MPGAQIDVEDNDSNTPLHLAALNGQSSMMSFLIECGANIYKYVGRMFRRGENTISCLEFIYYFWN